MNPAALRRHSTEGLLQAFPSPIGGDLRRGFNLPVRVVLRERSVMDINAVLEQSLLSLSVHCGARDPADFARLKLHDAV